jgi:hypothetical protein
LGPGRGPGRGGVGRGSLCGSSGIMNCRYLPFARFDRASAAHCGAVDTSCFCQHLTSIEAACSAKWPELAALAMALAAITPHS